MPIPRLELMNICKRFGSKKANQSISLCVRSGEVHAVVGENGAGKSTLMNIIYGLLKPDEGSIVWEGKERELQSPLDARKLGVGIVMQHFSLFESMSVLENLYLHASLIRKVNKASLEREAKAVSKKFGFDLDLNARVAQLSVGEQQRIEILRCLLQDNLKLLILDEPTAVLTPEEADSLIASLKSLAKSGCSVLYISHKLREVRAVADRASILRNGELTHSICPAELEEEAIAGLMMGVGVESSLPLSTTTQTSELGEDVLCVDSISTAKQANESKALVELSLRVKAGEVLGIAGIAGNGQDALINKLSGESLAKTGSIQFKGQVISDKGLAWRYKSGISGVVAERLERSVSATQSLMENVYLKQRLRKSDAWINWKAIREQTQKLINDFQVACKGPEDNAENLSGGNLQKFIMGRELSAKPKCLICHQPTWGVDIHAVRFIHGQIKELARSGGAVILISEDLDELMAVCDSLAVLHEGKLSEIRAVNAWSVSEIGQYMAGLNAQETAA